MKFNYKYTFLFFYFLAIIVLILAIYFFDKVNAKSSIYNVTNDNFKTTISSKKEYIHSFLNNNKESLNILSNNKLFTNYINNLSDEENSNQLFYVAISTSPQIFSISYIDIKGNEKIKVTRDFFLENRPISIILKEQLENKSKSDYFQSFLELEKDNLFLSEITLNNELNMATLKISKSIYNNANEKKGFLVIDILLDTFFNNLTNEKLFNVYLIDKYDRFILHPNSEKGIYSKQFDSYLSKDKFGIKNSKLLQTKEEYKFTNHYAQRIKLQDNNQNLILILESKFESLKENLNSEKLQIMYILMFLSILGLPLIIYFASTPENLQKKIIDQYITDDLTNLPNLEHLFKDFRENNFNDSLIILVKITNFKNIQNIYGFNVSKELQKECAYFLRDYTKSDTSFLKIYKIKYNVFAFKYLFKDKVILNQSLNKLQNSLESKEFNIFEKYDITIDSAIGVSGIDKINNDLNELKEAEIALEEALKLNLDISIYNNSHVENLEKYKANAEKVKVIKDAIINNNVLIAFQPIYNNKKRVVEKYEVLIRLKFQDKIFYPDEFLKISKKIKKYKTLTKIIIDKTFQYFQDKEFEFSINLSMEDVLDDEIRKYLFEEIVKYNVQNKLVIELVETEAINNYTAFTNFIKEIKRLNCKIAIDDFGSGYSNYEYIIKLSDYIDYLKIDGTLITDIDTNKKTQLLVGTLKFLCDSLKIKTIAEYVENKEIFDFVKSMDISYSQGYYIGKPEFELSVNEGIEEKDFDSGYF